MPQKNPCGSLVILALLSLFLWCPGCGREDTKPVAIGLAINLSGQGGQAGEHIRNGALLAVDTVNSQGGINGRPLQLLVRDDANTPEGIQLADSALLDAEVTAIIGHSFSANTITAYPLVTGRDTILITAYTATTSLSGKDDLFFRTSVDCALYGRKTSDLLNREGAALVSVLMDTANAEFVEDYLHQLDSHYSGTLHPVRFSSKEMIDWQALADSLLAPKPQAVLLLTESSLTALAAQKLRGQGFQAPLVATIWAQSPELLQIGGKACEGLSLVTFVDPDNQHPSYQQFARELREKFHETASARANRSYEIVFILADALRRCRTIDTPSLKAALLAGSYDTILGPLRFDRYGDVVRPIYEVTVRDGRFINRGEIR